MAENIPEIPVGPLTNPFASDLPFFPTEPVGLDAIDDLSKVFRNSVALPVSPKRLFEIFADAESWPRWVLGIGEVEWTSPAPFGVGTTRTVRFWGGMEVYETFMGWEEGRLMAFHFTGITQAIWWRFAERYEVSPSDTGCVLHWTVGYQPRGAFRALHGLIRPGMWLTFKLLMWRLRRYCARHALS